jgi:hypothetical protein
VEDLVLMLILSAVLPPAILMTVEHLRGRRKGVPS